MVMVMVMVMVTLVIGSSHVGGGINGDGDGGASGRCCIVSSTDVCLVVAGCIISSVVFISTTKNENENIVVCKCTYGTCVCW